MDPGQPEKKANDSPVPENEPLPRDGPEANTTKKTCDNNCGEQDNIGMEGSAARKRKMEEVVEDCIDAAKKVRKVTKRNRCNVCRKRLPLTAIVCRCGDTFCGIHRYSDRHDCSFDYKADRAEQLRKDYPRIIVEKIQKI